MSDCRQKAPPALEEFKQDLVANNKPVVDESALAGPSGISQRSTTTGPSLVDFSDVEEGEFDSVVDSDSGCQDQVRIRSELGRSKFPFSG